MIFIGGSGVAGYRRRDYLVSHPWSGGINYAFIPLGLSAFPLGFSLALMETNEELALTLSNIALFGCVIAIIFNVWQPDFLKPTWYKHLRKHHNDIWPVLAQEAWGDYYNWRRNTRTIEELEVWVQEVRAKHHR